MRKVLPESAVYTSIDRFPHTENTLVMDLESFNSNQITNKKGIMHGFCLGVLEHIKNKERFLKEVNRVCEYLIISYNLAKKCSKTWYEPSHTTNEKDFFKLIEKTNWYLIKKTFSK